METTKRTSLSLAWDPQQDVIKPSRRPATASSATPGSAPFLSDVEPSESISPQKPAKKLIPASNHENRIISPKFLA